MKTILKVVVGSRLHGLNKPDSDYDYRGVFMHPVEDILSPFKKIKNTSWIEGDVDNTAYELREFCKMATQGNPSVTEILYSNIVEEIDDIGKELVANRQKFLSSIRIFEAYKGYAHNQYNKMNLFEPDERTPKFAVAYIRSLWQGIGLLKTGEITNQVSEPLRSFLLEVKHDFKASLIPELGRKFSTLQVEIAEAYYTNQNKFQPDLAWIEDFVSRAYLQKELSTIRT